MDGRVIGAAAAAAERDSRDECVWALGQEANKERVGGAPGHSRLPVGKQAGINAQCSTRRRPQEE